MLTSAENAELVAAVLCVIKEHGPSTMDRITFLVGRPRDVIADAVKALTKAKTLKRRGSNYGFRDKWTDAAITVEPKKPSAGSWWVGKDRREFAETIATRYGG